MSSAKDAPASNGDRARMVPAVGTASLSSLQRSHRIDLLVVQVAELVAQRTAMVRQMDSLAAQLRTAHERLDALTTRDETTFGALLRFAKQPRWQRWRWLVRR